MADNNTNGQIAELKREFGEMKVEFRHVSNGFIELGTEFRESRKFDKESRGKEAAALQDFIESQEAARLKYEESQEEARIKHEAVSVKVGMNTLFREALSEGWKWFKHIFFGSIVTTCVVAFLKYVVFK